VYVFTPSVVFGALLWSGLTSYAGKPLKRIGLVLIAVVGPVIIVQVSPFLLGPWSPTVKETLDASVQARSLEGLIAAAKQDPRYANDPTFREEIAQHDRSLLEARAIIYSARAVRPIAASVLAGLAAGWVLLLTALVVSGKKGFAPWETPIVAGALLAVIVGLVISSIKAENPYWRVIETVSYACWTPTILCAALGLSRAATLSENTES
jgi:hypothetical protein